MRNLRKAAKMSALAFKNGIRLHKDSIYMYKLGSFPTSYQLSILAQEEIGKAFILEEHVFRAHEHLGEGDQPYETVPEIQKWLSEAILSHKSKQIWFSNQADGFARYKRRFVLEASNGVLEQEKQNATYVGLTKRGKDIDLNGKIVTPLKRVIASRVEKHITRVNDFTLTLIEGCRRGTHTVDTEDLDDELTMTLGGELENLWPLKAKPTITLLKKIRKFHVEVVRYSGMTAEEFIAYWKNKLDHDGSLAVGIGVKWDKIPLDSEVMTYSGKDAWNMIGNFYPPLWGGFDRTLLKGWLNTKRQDYKKFIAEETNVGKIELYKNNGLIYPDFCAFADETGYKGILGDGSHRFIDCNYIIFNELGNFDQEIEKCKLNVIHLKNISDVLYPVDLQTLDSNS